MKKPILFTCLMFLTAGTALVAQKTDTKKYEAREIAFGVKAGFNYANVWDSEGQDFNADPKLGLAGGLFLGIPIGQFLGVQPEILISQKGFQGSGSLLGADYSFKRTTTYLDIPLQLAVTPVEFLTIVAGPQYSYLLAAKNTWTVGEISNTQVEEFENDNIRKNVLGIVAGADVNISHVVISGRAGWDMVNNHGDGTSNTPRYKNRWVQLTVGFKI